MLKLEYYLEKLSSHGPVTAKKLFGGVGYYLHGVIFALVFEGDLYFRIDDKTRHEFEAYGARQFVYEARGRQVFLPYFTVPEKVLEERTLLGEWMEKAHGAALRNLSKKSKRKKKS